MVSKFQYVQKIREIDSTFNSFLRKKECLLYLVNHKGVMCNFQTTREFCSILSNHEGFYAINPSQNIQIY